MYTVADFLSRFVEHDIETFIEAVNITEGGEYTHLVNNNNVNNCNVTQVMDFKDTDQGRNENVNISKTVNNAEFVNIIIGNSDSLIL